MINRLIASAILGIIVTFAAILRFHGLGDRSLWGDEFCTWKVSQMPVAESLRWQPELTKPPLYQLAVRGISTPSPRPSFQERRGMVHQDSSSVVPSEWHLRLPAATCGVLAVVAMWWLGSMAGGWGIGAAGALLFAVHTLQIDYSQEARPYSMLVLGSILSTGCWYRLIARQRGNEATRQPGKVGWPVAYVLVTALSFHANYLMALTVAAHGLWSASFLAIGNRQSKTKHWRIVPVTLLATAAACGPMVWHFMQHRTSVFQGLDWIRPPTIGDAMKVLGDITFGSIWVWSLLVPTTIVYAMSTLMKPSTPPAAGERTWRQMLHGISESENFCGLLLIWLGVAWGGLLIVSWLAHPAMVSRYALPASAPAILLPLILLHRWDRRLPLLVAGLIVAGTASGWATRADRVKPGFRELVQFLDEYADPQREAVVVTIERTTSPGWEEMDLLGFEYYPSSKFKVQSSKKGNEATTQQGNMEESGTRRMPIEILFLSNRQPDGDQQILRDPRALWLVAFLADPMEAMAASGRRVEQISIGDKVFNQLYFEPYRLIRVASKK